MIEKVKVWRTDWPTDIQTDKAGYSRVHTAKNMVEIHKAEMQYVFIKDICKECKFLES